MDTAVEIDSMVLLSTSSSQRRSDSSRVLDVDSEHSGTIQTEVDMEHVDQSSYLFTDLYLLVDLAKSYSGNSDHQNQEPSECNVVHDVGELATEIILCLTELQKVWNQLLPRGNTRNLVLNFMWP